MTQPDEANSEIVEELHPLVDEFGEAEVREALDVVCDALQAGGTDDPREEIAFDADGPTFEPEVVDDVFPRGTVEVVGEEDGQYLLDGDTYDAKPHIKARIQYGEYDFDGDRKLWLVDVDVFETVHESLNNAGFLVEDARDEPEPEPEVDPAERMRSYVGATAEGDRITVEYEMKNGNGTNTKEGEVRKTTLPEEEEFADVPALRFQRDDGQRMYVRPDDYGKLALYTAMSHAPFVGDVTEVRVDGEPIPEPEPEPAEEPTDDAATTENDAADLPWN